MPDIFLMENFFLLFRVTSNPHNICRYFVSTQEVRTLKALLALPQGLTSFLSAQRAAFWRDLTTSLLDWSCGCITEWCSLRNWFVKLCDEIVFLESGLSPAVIIETCLFILWRHLEYYLLHCTPTDSQDSLFASRSLFKSRRLQGKLYSEN